MSTDIHNLLAHIGLDFQYISDEIEQLLNQFYELTDDPEGHCGKWENAEKAIAYLALAQWAMKQAEEAMRSDINSAERYLDYIGDQADAASY